VLLSESVSESVESVVGSVVEAVVESVGSESESVGSESESELVESLSELESESLVGPAVLSDSPTVSPPVGPVVPMVVGLSVGSDVPVVFESVSDSELPVDVLLSLPSAGVEPQAGRQTSEKRHE